MGARVILHSVNAGQSEGEELDLVRAYHEANLRLRARSGKLWIVVVDAADPKARLSSHAPSGVLDPSGRWGVKADPKGEQFFVHTIEIEK
jgi:predicted amidohydrolase